MFLSALVFLLILLAIGLLFWRRRVREQASRQINRKAIKDYDDILKELLDPDLSQFEKRENIFVKTVDPDSSEFERISTMLATQLDGKPLLPTIKSVSRVYNQQLCINFINQHAILDRRYEILLILRSSPVLLVRPAQVR